MLLRCESLEPPMSQLGQTGKSPRRDQRPVYLQQRTYLMTAGTAAGCQL